MRYQWYFNSAPIAGANASTLVLTNVQSEHAGIYYLAVSNLVSMTNSQSASLTIGATPAGRVLAATKTHTEQTEQRARMLIEMADDEVRLSIIAPAGRYEVLVSSDLHVWHVAGELNVSGPAMFTHRTNATASFYRLLRIEP